MGNTELTFGDIMVAFHIQFPGLKVDDIRPNGMNQIYVWIKNSPTNIIATYIPEEDTFKVESTRKEWGLL